MLRAAMNGGVVGIDYSAALALAPADCDRDALQSLLAEAEIGLLAGFAKHATT